MRYSNRDCFIISAIGAMQMEPCSLESIMAGSSAGAQGCVVPVDVSSDGVTLVCASGSYPTAGGERVLVSENQFEEIRAVHPKVVCFGQALELAKSGGAKVGVELHHPQAAAQVRISLKYSEYLENAYFCGLTAAQASKLAAQYPDLQVMADLTETPPNAAAFVRAAQKFGLFGLRAAPAVLTEELCTEALRCGLFLASTDTIDAEELRQMIAQGVNFVETSRPDLAAPMIAPEPIISDEENG